MTFKISTFIIFWAMMLTACAPSPEKPAGKAKIPVRVVVITLFEMGEDTGDRPGEFQNWVERFPLDSIIPFPQGYRNLRYNAEKQVLGICTGIGTAHSAASIMALGMDDRFDLSKAYFLVAGIAGVDPEDATVGSAIWANWLVDGDLSHEIDPREMPKEWKTGYLPLRKKEPYEQPVARDEAGEVFRLDSSLVNWAYGLTKNIALPETEEMKVLRAKYVDHAAAQQAPQVMIGDQLAAMTYWHGAMLNQWANDWVGYWTEGKGNFVTSAMEDTGVAQSLAFLDKAGKVDKKRLLVLRTGSNFTMQYPGISAAESLSREKITGEKVYSAFVPSLDAAYLVGSAVVLELVGQWQLFQNQLPE
jgi:purine nucleoside permease